MAVAQRDSTAPADRPTLWFALAAFAILAAGVAAFRLVFLVGLLGVGLAAGAGALAWYSLDRGYAAYVEQRRHRPPPALSKRARELTLAPSFEVYDARSERERPRDRFGPGP